MKGKKLIKQSGFSEMSFKVVEGVTTKSKCLRLALIDEKNDIACLADREHGLHEIRAHHTSASMTWPSAAHQWVAFLGGRGLVAIDVSGRVFSGRGVSGRVVSGCGVGDLQK